MSKATSIFKYREFNKSSLELLINRELWFAKPDTLNDPFECQMIFRNILDSMWAKYKFDENLKTKIEAETEKCLSNAGICSFSKTRQNQLMWAHYADEHKGFCIGFKHELLIENTNEIGSIDVLYQSDYPYEEIFKIIEKFLVNLDGDLTKTIIWSIVYKIMQTKYTYWSYERELRLTRLKYGALAFSPIAVNSIAFGLRMSERDKKTLRELLSGPEWKHLKWFQTHKSDKKFGLVFKQI